MSLEQTYREAKLLLERGELGESCKLFTAFIDSQSTHESRDLKQSVTDAYNSRGHIKYLWVCFDEAISDYTEAIKRDPEFAIAHYNRGQVHYRLGRYRLAERDLKKALELNSELQDAKLNLQQVQKDLESGHQFNVSDTFEEFFN